MEERQEWMPQVRLLLFYLPQKNAAYVTSAVTEINLPEETQLPAKPKWSTVFIAAGKKTKVNKVDIVGFLGNKGQLKKKIWGLLKDFFLLLPSGKQKAATLQLIKYEKIKNKR